MTLNLYLNLIFELAFEQVPRQARHDIRFFDWQKSAFIFAHSA